MAKPGLGARAVEWAKSFLNQRRRAYQLAFGGVSGDAVLRDLARFCRAHGSTFHSDPQVAARLDGRREVFLRIQTHLRLSEQQLWDLYGRIDQ